MSVPPEHELQAKSHTTLLWLPGDQTERLHELLGNDPESKETPLRRDVRSLGQLLGDTIREQQGDALFDAVETLRHLMIRSREEDSGALLADALARVDALSL